MSTETVARIMFDSDSAEFVINSNNATIRAHDSDSAPDDAELAINGNSVPKDFVLTDRNVQGLKQGGYRFATLMFIIVSDGDPIDISISHGKGSVKDHSRGGWAQVHFAGNKYVSSDYVDGDSKEFTGCPVTPQ